MRKSVHIKLSFCDDPCAGPGTGHNSRLPGPASNIFKVTFADLTPVSLSANPQTQYWPICQLLAGTGLPASQIAGAVPVASLTTVAAGNPTMAVALVRLPALLN